MPITPFLDGERFDLEGERVLRIAFEMVCIGLRTGDCDDGVKQAIATKLTICCQSVVIGAKAEITMRTKRASAASFGADAKNAVTGVGAPS